MGFFIALNFCFITFAIAGNYQEKINNKDYASMALIDAGTYRPLYLSKDSPFEIVDSFYIDRLPITNAQYYQFVEAHPEWNRITTPRIFAEDNYLMHWHQSAKNYAPNKKDLNKPVVNVSWFAAQAFCESENKRLPSVAEWEYVASASDTAKDGSDDPEYHQKILNWYSKPNSLSIFDVNQSPANYWGVKDLHALIWEWTDDFNTALVSGESRADSSIDKNLFCGAGASGSADPSNYAAFMRFGFRSSLQAKFTLSNLGFRCAASQNPSPAFKEIK